jgi:transketolase
MEPSKSLSGNGSEELNQLHIWRSKFLDKTAKIEGELKRLARSSTDAKLQFKALAEKLLATQNAGKTKAEKNDHLIKLLQELLPIIELRAELAHSQLINAGNADSGLAMFKNANCIHPHFDRITVISSDQRKKAYDRLAWIAGQLASIP